MVRPHALRPPVLSRRASRMMIALLLAVLVAESLDAAGRGASLVAVLADLMSPAGLAGSGTVAALGWVAARHETRVPCQRLSRRLATMVAVLVCGLLVHEVAAMLLHAEHADGLPSLAAHASTAVLPVAGAFGAAVALSVGVAHVARRVWPGPSTGAAPAARPAAAPRRPARRDAAPPAGLLLARHLAGRAPPSLVG